MKASIVWLIRKSGLPLIAATAANPLRHGQPVRIVADAATASSLESCTHFVIRVRSGLVECVDRNARLRDVG